MKRTVIYFISLALLLYVAGFSLKLSAQVPSNLKCEYQREPLGLDVIHPRLFWEVPSLSRNTNQSAYQILVASSIELLNEGKTDCWNSGKVLSGSNIQVEYEGKPLQSSKRYYWKVRFWDQNGNVSSYSDHSWWENGLIEEKDWQASWIYNGIEAPKEDSLLYIDTPNPLFRKEFQISKKIKSARLYISGLGYYEAYLNGKKIGDHMLDPGWTNYSKRIQYLTYDVTNLLADGSNALGVMLGNGWYNPMPLYFFNRLNLRNVLTIGQPKFISQLRVEFEDGTFSTIISDESWKTGDGPILMNNVYLGERYDASLEQEGWSSPLFNDSGWKKARQAASPGGRLMAMIQPPIRITRRVIPINITEPKPGIYIVDMGQNFAGVANLRVSGPAGTKVQMRYGELLNADGTLNDRSTIACHIMEGGYVQHRPGAPLNANQTDSYILKGKGIEDYHSRFTFHGFRYVELTGFPGKPTLESLTGLRMNSDVEKNGSFECSNTLLNKIQQNTEWTLLSNVFSIESDCPGREKFGYGGDIVTASEAYIYNFNMANFYTKSVQNFQDDQRPSGGMPECAPDNAIYDAGLTDDTGPIGWTLAHPWVQQKLYQYYGDKKIISDQYESTRKLVEFIKTQTPDYIVTKGISDHESIDKKPVQVSGTAFYFHHVKLLADFAGILGKKEEAIKYNILATEIKKAFIEKFATSPDGKIDFGSEGCQAIALYYNLVPDEKRSNSISVLKTDIVQQHNNHISTGIFGTKMLFDVLRENDMNDIAYAMNCQKTKPGYGYMIENGATTIWESWNGGGSRNHPMFGSISEWFFKSLGGIVPDKDAAGFAKLVIKPFIPTDMEWMKTSYNSVRGKISSSWNKQDGKVSMQITIPGNTEAEIYIPCIEIESIKESGKKVAEVKDLRLIRTEGNYSIFRTGSGSYNFEFPANKMK